jgi:hypothetical protein
LPAMTSDHHRIYMGRPIFRGQARSYNGCAAPNRLCRRQLVREKTNAVCLVLRAREQVRSYSFGQQHSLAIALLTACAEGL